MNYLLQYLEMPHRSEKSTRIVDKLEAKQAIARLLGKPLAELPLQQLEMINQIVDETLNKDQAESRVRQYFRLSLHQVLNKE